MEDHLIGFELVILVLLLHQPPLFENKTFNKHELSSTIDSIHAGLI